MDNSFREEGSRTQPGPKRFSVSLLILKNLIRWLKGLFRWTEEDQEEAGIYLDRPGGE